MINIILMSFTLSLLNMDIYFLSHFTLSSTIMILKKLYKKKRVKISTFVAFIRTFLPKLKVWI